ncbi:hypothetical protein CHS0354_036367 [Potamilus streckersoni]|uniref:Uncharacterized protein n=1 Tax=Potamilus streckersoni TaxID=2493646 RepID=A0AAE0VZS3_9BIVA|nr:hypothetical protein CHS0354_036367 [Potamilus streckersoni]
MELFNITVMLLLVTTTLAESCNTKWLKILENDEFGLIVTGSKEDLVKAVLVGAQVRVYVPEWGYLTSLQNLHTITNEICGQAVFHISKFAYDRFLSNAYWYFLNLCSTGNVHASRWMVGEHTQLHVKPETKYNLGMQWFVRKLGCREEPLLSHTEDGTVISGNVLTLANAVRSGFDIRAVDRRLGYTFAIDNLDISINSSSVSAQSLWHVSEQRSGNHFVFQPDSYWWFTIWSTNGYVHITRWSIGDHSNRGDSVINEPIDWFSDPCWMLAYQSYENGTLADGSLELLVSAVLSGHRVRIVRGGYSVEADQINVRGGQVSAQVLSHVSKANITSFQENVYWYWQELSTTGSVRTIRYNVGENTNRGNSIAVEEMAWYIDTRKWRKVYGTNIQGISTFGNKVDLAKAVREGAEVRYRLYVKDHPNDSILMQADNLAVNSDGNVGAMHVRSVSLVNIETSEVEFQANPYWWFTIVSTTGRVDISRWTVGEHVDRGHSNEVMGVDWFVNE